MKKDVWGILLLIIIIVLVGWSAYRSDRATEGGLTTAPTEVEENMTMQQDLSEYVTHNVEMETSAGTINLELYGRLVPGAVNNFVTLANDGFYDDTRFHRIIKDFMIQGGDPNTKGGEGKEIPLGAEGSWGTGGPGYTFETEFTDKLVNQPGTIAMANGGGTDTNGSQFFINLVENTHLNTNGPDGSPKNCNAASCHTVFGQVTEGMDIVNELGLVEVRNPVNDHKPIEDVVLVSVKVTEVATDATDEEAEA